MIDFQNSGLEYEVYLLITKMCDLAKSDSFPKFKTTKITDGEWKCELSIPGVKDKAIAYQKDEVSAINRCASNMLYILETQHKNGEYDPDIYDSYFRENIEEFFGNLEYDCKYLYYMMDCDVLVRPDEQLAFLLRERASESIDNVKDQGDEVIQMCDIVSLRFLVRHIKKNIS